MKKNTKIYLQSILVLLLCVSLLFGCKKQESSSESTFLIIIAGIHSNSKQIDFPLKSIIEKIYSEIGNIGIIIADGTPAFVREDNHLLGVFDKNSILESKVLKENNEDKWKENDLFVKISALNSKIKSLKPDAPEVDMLAALHEATKAFSSNFSETTSKKEIVIYDTGLSTSGSMSFLKKEYLNILNKETIITENDVKSVIESLEITAEIPNLSDVKVTWYGIGEVAEPQPALNSIQTENLKIIWKEILKRAGADTSDNKDAEYGYFIPTITSSEVLNYKQPVSLVIDWENIGNIASRGVVIPTDKLEFRGNTSVFTSQKRAEEVLLPYAKNLLNYPNMDILLVGTTSDPNHNGGDIILSEKRAKVVKKCFVDLGIPKEKINVLGWGSKEPLYDPKEWENGKYIESVAVTNRRVIILPADSQLAKQLVK